ncbi:MAG: FtsX-like permease family protein [Weeksellaceae bacterium]
MIYNWIKIAFRNFAKNKMATFINVFGLTIGMVGVILTLLYWKDELSYNQWNSEKSEVYQVVHDMGDEIWSTASIPEGQKMKEIFPEIEDYLYLNWQGGELVKTEGKSLYMDGILPTTNNFFEFFPFEFIEGSAQNVLSDGQSMAISKKWAKTLYGDEKAVGKTIEILDKAYIVKGVYENEVNSSENPEAVIPMDWKKIKEEQGEKWGNYSFRLYVKIPDKKFSEDLVKRINHEIVYVSQVLPNAQKEGISTEEYESKYGKTEIIFDQLNKMRLFAVGDGGTLGKGKLSMLYIFSGLSLVILLLSCVNFINLTTANAMKRAKEVGVRKAVGARRKNIIVQFMFESAVLCVFSFLLALTLVEVILPYFNQYLNKSMQLSLSDLFGYFVLILLLVILVSGFFPAIYLSQFQPLKVLKGNFSRSKSGVLVRNVLMGFQFFISTFFLIGGLIVYLQVHYMMTRDLGFNADQTVMVYLNDYRFDGRYDKYKRIKQEFNKIDGVEKITAGMRVPGYLNSVTNNLSYLDQSINAASCAMDFDYLDMMQVQLVEGRMLSAEISSDTIQNVLVNETMVKELGIKDPIGKQLQSGMLDEKLVIVGVVEDFFIEGFDRKIKPTLFFHWHTVDWQQYNFSAVLFKIQPEKTASVLNELQKRWETDIEPGYPFSYSFVDDQFAKTYDQYKKQKNLFLILTIVVVLIALLGLFGLISFVIEQRMREISIRKTLGASQKDIIEMFSKKYIIIAVIAVFCSIPLTYYLMKMWLENFVYRIEIPWWPFAVAFLVLTLLALLVIGFRTLKAVKENPIKYLKYE